MTLEEYDIVKLHDKLDNRNVYVAVLRVNKNTAKVKLLKQPSYNLSVKRFADGIFTQHCHHDDEVYQQLLNFNQEDFTFEISESMWIPVIRDELIEILQHLIYINITKDDLGKSIVSNGISKLRFL